jgi:hypothetical protein
MKSEYHQALIAVLARLDRITAEAIAICKAPGDVEVSIMAEDLYEFANDVRAVVESKLEQREP